MTLEALRKLTESDARVLQDIKQTISSKSPDLIHKKINEMIQEDGKQIDERRLFALSENDLTLRKFFETNELFNTKLAESERYPSYLPKKTFASIDGAVICSPFRELMGAYLLGESEKCNSALQADVLLDKACDEKSYHALAARMEKNLQSISTLEIPDDLVQLGKTIDNIFADADQMSNIYRSLGDMHNATILQEVAAAVFNKPNIAEGIDSFNNEKNTKNRLVSESKSEEGIAEEVPPIIQFIEKILEKTIENFYLAYLTVNDPDSIMINDSINRGQDLLAVYREHFSDWEKGKDYFIDTVLKEGFHMKYRSPDLFFNSAAKLAIKEHNQLLERAKGFSKN